MWFGKTTFKAAIKDGEISRGLRLRKENIQIGEDDTLRDMFTREASKRGNNYFIGEIFGVSRELIPNSQRTYFNENPVRVEFEHKLKDYFNNTLYYIYYEGSDINANIKRIHSYAEKASLFEKKIAEGGFLSTEEREREQQELETKKLEAERATKNLEKKREGGKSFITPQIIERRISEVSNIQSTNETTDDKTSSEEPHKIPSQEKKKFLVDKMFPTYNKSERKLLSETLEKIFIIIQKSTDKKTSESIINKIKEELK